MTDDNHNVNIFENKLELMISNKIQELAKTNEDVVVVSNTDTKVTKKTRTTSKTKTSSKST